MSKLYEVENKVNINYSITMINISNGGFIMQVILIQLFLVAVINAEYWPHTNASNEEPLLRSIRMKRAPFHKYIPSRILTATIKDGDKEIHLTWKRIERYLFNKNLPVYTARMNSWGPAHKKSKVMNKIGETIMYQDIKQKSAIIYFENMGALHGVVGQSYSILNLPINALSQPLVVGGPYIVRMKNYPSHGRTELNSDILHEQHFGKLNMKEDPAHPSASSDRSSSDSVSESFYVETLLLVTHDIFQYVHHEYQEHFSKSLITDCLLHFNAVDMMFTDLPKDNFEIYINLAGIIVEEEHDVFSSILQYQPLRYDGQRDLYVDDFLLEKISQYPDYFDFPFAKDAVDLIVVFTGRELTSLGAYFSGLSWRISNIFQKRLEDGQFRSVPTVLTTLSDVYSTYPMTVRYIGTLLGIVSPDPYDKGITEDGIQCYGIMQMLNDHCTNCLTWSDESIEQLKLFFRENQNRCFLLNKPRSLHPPGTPVISVSPCRQCTCYGFRSYREETLSECPLNIPSDSCDKPLSCKYKDCENKLELYSSAILPLDGTPCGENKVCWNEECKSISRRECK